MEKVRTSRWIMKLEGNIKCSREKNLLFSNIVAYSKGLHGEELVVKTKMKMLLKNV